MRCNPISSRPLTMAALGLVLSACNGNSGITSSVSGLPRLISRLHQPKLEYRPSKHVVTDRGVRSSTSSSSFKRTAPSTTFFTAFPGRPPRRTATTATVKRLRSSRSDLKRRGISNTILTGSLRPATELEAFRERIAG